MKFSNDESKTRTAREEQSSYNMTIHRNKIILYNCNNGEMYYPGVCLSLFLNANYKTKVKKLPLSSNYWTQQRARHIPMDI